MTLIKTFLMGLSVAVFSTSFVGVSKASAADTDVLPTSTDDISFYRTAAGWIVYKNATRESCFVTKKDDNSAIQMGLTKNKKIGYLGAFLKDYPVRSGRQHVTFKINDRKYTGTAQTVSRELTEGYRGAYVLVNNKHFVRDIEFSQELVAHLQHPHKLTMNTSGAYFAIYEAKECMKAF